ncbi:MAG: heparinase II/III family protein, partial [Pseudomonadota bacterium]
AAWLDRYETWSADAWAPYSTAERLTHLCAHGGVLLKGGDAMWRSRMLASMARQTRHLTHVGHRAKTDYDRLLTACGLAIAALCLPGCETPLERGLETLRRELRLQIRPDGGHVSRNPSNQLTLVIRLQMMIECFEARNLAAPGFLKHVSARATAFLKLFRCGDGRLAVFNGGYEDDGRAVSTCLARGETDALPSGFARRSGFQRLEAGRLALIADTGLQDRSSSAAPTPKGDRYNGTGAFQLSSGRSRLVVNCGAGAHLSGDWTRALRKAAAHSALSADRRSPEAAVLTSTQVAHRRGEDARGQLLEIERKLALEAETLFYARRFFLGARGEDLRGEDRLTGASRAFVFDLALRFHLHPSVRASMARDGKSVLLAAPNHEGWRFKSNCSDITLEKSVYCGEGGAPQATEQIVVRLGDLEPRPDGDMVAKWAFRRVEPSARRLDV